ncbi:MAG: hypothetical protein B6I24_04545 [Bacteroidetes bacterium 4572_128]|nr:MAG: hypothetical protein B6I24_04545 [Bacteroidetes bacterium 4572_128]
MKDFIRNEIGNTDGTFIEKYYQVSDKFKLWDTLYAETISSSVDKNKFFKERLESTIVISEIMERYKTLTDTSILLHTILDRVTFTFPDYLMKQIPVAEFIDQEANTRTEKLELLAKLEIALSEINARIRAEKIKNKNLQILNEVAAEIYAPENPGTAQN